MLLSIIIPAYQEEKTIAKVIRKISGMHLDGMDKEIIVVDDGSDDGTCKEVSKFRHVRLLRLGVNRGKGAAVRQGLENARGDVILIQDADMEYDPKDYPRLVEPILKGRTDVVYGSRTMGRHHDMYVVHKFGNYMLTKITNLFFGVRLTDMETGYKVFRRKVIKGMKLKARRFDFEPEITAKIIKRGYKILEVPISFNPRGFDEGKKITWRDGLKALYYIIRYRIAD